MTLVVRLVKQAVAEGARCFTVTYQQCSVVTGDEPYFKSSKSAIAHSFCFLGIASYGSSA
eukprot:557625-Pleurochrysis_carterae.AAC.1